MYTALDEIVFVQNGFLNVIEIVSRQTATSSSVKFNLPFLSVPQVQVDFSLGLGVNKVSSLDGKLCLVGSVDTLGFEIQFRQARDKWRYKDTILKWNAILELDSSMFANDDLCVKCNEADCSILVRKVVTVDSHSISNNPSLSHIFDNNSNETNRISLNITQTDRHTLHCTIYTKLAGFENTFVESLFAISAKHRECTIEVWINGNSSIFAPKVFITSDSDLNNAYNNQFEAHIESCTDTGFSARLLNTTTNTQKKGSKQTAIRQPKQEKNTLKTVQTIETINNTTSGSKKNNSRGRTGQVESRPVSRPVTILTGGSGSGGTKGTSHHSTTPSTSHSHNISILSRDSVNQNAFEMNDLFSTVGEINTAKNTTTDNTTTAATTITSNSNTNRTTNAILHANQHFPLHTVKQHRHRTHNDFVSRFQIESVDFLAQPDCFAWFRHRYRHNRIVELPVSSRFQLRHSGLVIEGDSLLLHFLGEVCVLMLCNRTLLHFYFAVCFYVSNFQIVLGLQTHVIYSCICT